MDPVYWGWGILSVSLLHDIVAWSQSLHHRLSSVISLRRVCCVRGAVPGLLLSFAARLDAAKSLVGVVSGGGSNNGAVTSSHTCPQGTSKCCSFWCCCCSGGYFPPLTIAYAIGLLMANVAVYVMQMGQPALLYLVPCTLGTMSFIGWRRSELLELWDGPRLISTADEIVYGRNNGSTDQCEDAQRDDNSDSRNDTSNNQVEAGDVPLLSNVAS